ncbi:hypothetical protein [Rubinisphaera sp.]|uniref:hypothetical protein n=1 Tax=Rubinisphaera sp. TaxID=2024857 RepID=UPI000C0C8034|nr:hypothetical protein [Rubinisphaera sp.]MBV10394.1 hypothetical protein [Rubinisphaera sp.]HCS50635.1 hypothetical protein [Planctomycetaceae bacterium]|tara:strand:+ start:377 stop:571 length:195 start_codon:yes stop_codon:yes gene_type:complete
MSDDQCKKNELANLADEAFLDASKQVIDIARRTGTPVIVWRDGAIKELYYDSKGNEVAGNRHVD